MYVAVIPNRGSPLAILRREGYREAGKTKNRTAESGSPWRAVLAAIAAFMAVRSIVASFI
jgi:hypothetical protein